MSNAQVPRGRCQVNVGDKTARAVPSSNMCGQPATTLRQLPIVMGESAFIFMCEEHTSLVNSLYVKMRQGKRR